ncbi:DUF4303 domain-containing protein [Streptomyces sp. NPDC004609]|uniref:DUF4303 domain-containing protein n=1 Tax=Streptomyces sp. NPDC004609 TaxID=3364704 RepID=UPI0036A1471B
MNVTVRPGAQEIERIRASVREASQRAWTGLRRARPSESYYYFGLWTTGVIHRPAPTACSSEGLTRVSADYAARGMEVAAGDLRWSEADSPYDLFGDGHFAAVEALFACLGDPYDRPEEVNEALLRALVGALKDLDREGFFGTGSERHRIVVNVTLPGDEDEVSMVERARGLNPAPALRQYEKDLLPGAGGTPHGIESI